MLNNMIKPLIMLLCFHVIYAKNHNSIWLKVSNGGEWGSWGPEERCNHGTYAVGFSLKIEEKQGNGDDSSLNGIKLYCGDRNGTITGQIASTVGAWGEWGSPTYCPKGLVLVSFKLQVESWVRSGDDTAANGIQFVCREKDVIDQKIEIGHHGFWGTFGCWSKECPVNEGISGMKTKVETPQGHGDDTALNDVILYCG